MRSPMSPAEAAEVLGVPLDASIADIQHAYLRAARQVHPDVLQDAPAAEREDAATRFDRLTQAREVLLEQRPVLPIEVAEPAARPVVGSERGRGIGGSLAVLALLVFLLIAIVSLNDAFRASTAGTIEHPDAPVATSVP
jgi:hypothetical protein